MTQQSAIIPSIGIILVHGYLGSPRDLAPLAKILEQQYGLGAVNHVRLPEHGDDVKPAFNEDAFLGVLAIAIDRQRAAGRPFVLIGHSTGGSLLLSEITRQLKNDAHCFDTLQLIVLCATPPRIDRTYVERWNAHVANPIDYGDVGALVSLVNRLARRRFSVIPAPTLIIHGTEDELVPSADAKLWHTGWFSSPPQQIYIVGARHHLFTGEYAATAVNAVCKAIQDATTDAIAICEPLIANIEITTCCTLSCVACARTQLKLPSRFMSRDDFCRVLAQLPHARRIVFVGLGEPLLHPEIADFIALAAATGCDVGLVTNAMSLNEKTASLLCASGLSRLTFSLDAVDQALANRVRRGSDMAVISDHIHGFMAEKQRQGVDLKTSAFTALRRETVSELEAIIDFVADHHIDALMVTDLNFSANQPTSVHASFTPEHASILRKALKRAAARQLPVLSVWGLEEFAMETNYLDYLLLRGEMIAHRSQQRTHCLSPWQTIPINVSGALTICDCQPTAVIGNIHHTPISDVWHGSVMQAHRQRMLSNDPPKVCRVCPRF